MMALSLNAAAVAGARAVMQAVVNLVADQPHALGFAPGGDGGQFVGAQHAAGRIARAGDDQPVRRRVDLPQHRHCRLVARGGVSRQQGRAQAQRRQDIDVRRVERGRQRHPVAGVKRRQERQRERPGGAGGHGHPRRWQVEAVPIGQMRRDPLAQGRPAERLGVAERLPGAQRRGDRVHRAARRAGGRLAHLHADHVRRPGRQRRLARVGGGDDVHDDERRGFGATADLQRHYLPLLPIARPAPRKSVAQPHEPSSPGK